MSTLRKRSLEVTLIAVSKTKPISMIEEAYELGIRILAKQDPGITKTR